MPQIGSVPFLGWSVIKFQRERAWSLADGYSSWLGTSLWPHLGPTVSEMHALLEAAGSFLSLMVCLPAENSLLKGMQPLVHCRGQPQPQGYYGHSNLLRGELAPPWPGQCRSRGEATPGPAWSSVLTQSRGCTQGMQLSTILTLRRPGQQGQWEKEWDEWGAHWSPGLHRPSAVHLIKQLT